jgi:hypothetical protein
MRKHAQRQRHVETPGFAAVGSVAHRSSTRAGISRKANIGTGKLQRESQEIMS